MVLEFLDFSQQLVLIVRQGTFSLYLLLASHSGWRNWDVIPTLGIAICIMGRQRMFCLMFCLFGWIVMKPFPVLLAQRLVGPPKEVTLFLGTGHKQLIGVLWGVALLKRSRFTAKAQQTAPHVAYLWMRLTIHLLHIVMGFVFATKQQTRLNGTFDIVPSLLGLARLQTNLMARANHVVRRTGWRMGSRVLKGGTLKDGSHSHHSFQPFIVILGWGRWRLAFGFSKFFRTVIHPRQCELRRTRLGVLVYHAIQFVHQLLHGCLGFFLTGLRERHTFLHDLYQWGIMVTRYATQISGLIFLKRLQSHGSHILNILLLLLSLPGRVRAFGRCSLPTRIWITSWRDIAIFQIGGHPD